MLGLVFSPPDILVPNQSKDQLVRRNLASLIKYTNPNFSLETIDACLDIELRSIDKDTKAQALIKDLLAHPEDINPVYKLLSFIASPAHVLNKLKQENTPNPTSSKHCNDWDTISKSTLSMFKFKEDGHLTLLFVPVTETSGSYSLSFKVFFPTKREAGLNNLYLHNCPSKLDSNKPKAVSFTVCSLVIPAYAIKIEMIERNVNSFLSAGDAALPIVYFIFGSFYTILSFVWITYLCISNNRVYKLHYLMFAVILAKSMSVTFQAVDYHVLGKYGFHERGWSTMFYIAHLIRGALFFTTILLIGAGWAFIKHMLTKRERYVFAIVVPLQVLANIATIVIEESEEGSIRYATWRQIFIFVDLLCCGAILFPVLWSIKHLQTASQIDGKAAVNLQKLRLFRQFYIMVISYVYLTRIIAYLLRITVYYNLTWTVELFKECITLIFMVAVGVKFRPTEDNPYLRVATEDEEEEDLLLEKHQLDAVRSQSGFNDGAARVVSSHFTKSQPPAPLPMKDSEFTTLDFDIEDHADDSARAPLIPGSQSRFKNPNKES
ncbi:hypothetical protein Ciccas_002572 [Cichlidogyrus casuarinus]|uniref:GOST seven transmembrane domain-containing protein n=1 Tax=Cichlidogyrus casuarinus TaxID=1844966 RepID=A0ABD2QH85_9PLAT